MDSEFPDPEEEFEMRYADELELMQELEYDDDKPPVFRREHDKVRKSLKFGGNAGAEPVAKSSTSIAVELESETVRKRQQDELFGSLSDEEFNSAVNPAKRVRQDIIPCVPSVKELSTTDLPVIRSKRHVFRIIPEEPHQTVLSPSGQRLYIRIRSENLLKEKQSSLVMKGTGKLLNIPIQLLKQQVEDEIRRNACAVSEEQFERKLHQLEELRLKKETISQPETADTVADSTELWMERYRPKNYLDLLSEEGVNRTLLHWVKLWDKIVFHREVKIKVPKEDVSKPKWSSVINPRFDAKKFDKFPSKKNNESELKEELDSLGRPLQRVVLISGPPGLGKTTLAHVVARHAGYNVVEMNASDDRNAEAFQLQLEAATQMRSVLSSKPEPNCLVIDEIDGAPAASISYLVQVIQSQGEPKDKVASKKKKNGPAMVSRPIICICNDLYTPSLRPLRQIALVLQFPPTNPTRLAQRLMSISKEHDMKSDMSALLALCEKAEFDIRSCLATLYFLKTRKRQLRYSDVANLNIGQKDMHKSLFQVWQEIFHIPRQKRREFIELKDNRAPLVSELDRPVDPNIANTSATARLSNILHAVHSCGDYDRLLQGVFENYPNIKFKDCYFSAICTGLDWMAFYDIINRDIQRSQNYTMMPYLPYVFVAVHFQFAAVLSQKIAFPSTQAEVSMKTNQNTSIVSSMLQDLKASVRATNTRDTIIRDIIPFMIPIITPALRPVSAQLYSAAEKELIQRVIEIMISYNLTYRQEKTMDGAYRYVLEPDVEQVTSYGTQSNRRSLAYALKQMLAREIELEKMRQYESNLGPIIVKAVAETPTESKVQAAEPPVPNHKLALKPKAVTPSYKPATDFFGRVISTSGAKKCSNDGKEPLRNDIWYHFKEGYSNAVRRNVKISDFI